MAVYFGQTIRGMTHVHPLTRMKFSSRTSREIEELYFPDAEKQFLNQIGIITDVDSDTKPETYHSSTDFYYDTNKNGRFGDKGDTFAFKIILHVSKNGNKIKEAYEVCKPQQGEILLFLEDNGGDFSKQILRGRVANDVRERVKATQLYSTNVVEYVNKKFPLSQMLLKQLMEKGHIEEEITFTNTLLGGFQYIMATFFAPAKAMGWIITKIGDGVDYLKISDKIWDTENEDYFLNRRNVVNAFKVSTSPLDALQKQLENDKTKFEFNDLIPGFITKNIQKIILKLKMFIENYNVYIEKKIDAIYTKIVDKTGVFLTAAKISERIAFYSGIWNGLIDFIASTLKFVGGILEAPFNIATKFQKTLENIDSFIDTLVTIKWEKVYKAFSETYTKIITYFKKANSEDFNYVRIAYTVGFGVAFVGTFFIPYTQLVKIGALQKITKVQQEFFSAMKTIVANTKTHIVTKSKQAYSNSLKLYEQLLRIFAKDGDLVKYLEKIWKQILDWLVKNKELFKRKIDKLKIGTTLLNKINKIKGLNITIEKGQYIFKYFDITLKKGSKLQVETAVNRLFISGEKSAKSKLNLLVFGTRVPRLAKEMLGHLKYGHLTIQKINSQFPRGSNIISEYKYIIGKGGKTPANFRPPYVAKFKTVSGIHIKRYIRGSYRKIKEVVETIILPNGDKAEKVIVEVFVKEGNKWTKKKKISTLFPNNWSDFKIKKAIKEAAENIYFKSENKFRGISKEGIKIEFYYNKTKKGIKTAYIIN